MFLIFIICNFFSFRISVWFLFKYAKSLFIFRAPYKFFSILFLFLLTYYSYFHKSLIPIYKVSVVLFLFSVLSTGFPWWHLVFLVLFCFFRATSEAHGGSQAKGPDGATAANLHRSHSNIRSEPCLQPTATAHCNARSLTHWERPGIEPITSWFLVGFVSTVPQGKFHILFCGPRPCFSMFWSCIWDIIFCIWDIIFCMWDIIFRKNWKPGMIFHLHQRKFLLAFSRCLNLPVQYWLIHTQRQIVLNHLRDPKLGCKSVRELICFHFTFLLRAKLFGVAS